jgi:dolichyl-diphosphooligosaccharide--protein glycosyltransferase
MLDCGSNKAFKELNDALNNTPRSIEILDEIVTLEKQEAGKILLENGLTKKEASLVLKYTHCEPPEDFFITSEDMVGKAGVWSHFGSWDFSRAEMYNKVKGRDSEEGKKILMDPRYNLTPEQADQYYYEIQTQDDSQWITPWPGYMSGVQPCEMPSPEGIMICNQGISGGQQLQLVINLTNMDVKIQSREDLRPMSLVYVTENGTEEKTFSGSLLGFSVVLIPRGEAGYGSLITHPYLANSIFTRLFYTGGHGLEYFDQFSDQQGISGGRILVWKIDWEGTDPNVVYKAVEADDIDGNETAEMDLTEEEIEIELSAEDSNETNEE